MDLKNVTHVTASVSTFGGGIPEALSALVSCQHDAGLEVNAIGHQDEGSEISRWPGHHLSALPTHQLPGMTWAPGMTETLANQSPSIIHTHGLWTQASISVPNFAAKSHVPYIVSPHGMLDEWALNCSRLKKRIAAPLFEDRHLKRASCLHALCRPEAKSFRAYGITGPIAVIPNGVDPPKEVTREPEPNQRPILLFLGRIHPKKGLANALQAFTKAENSEDWLFIIAGWDQGDHLQELHQLCDEHQIRHQDVALAEFLSDPKGSDEAEVVFVGSAFGEEKDQLLRRSDAFILPSFSEGMPMSVLEAWSYRLPVIMTPHCNIPEGFDSDAAIQIGTDISEMPQVLSEFFKSDTRERTRIGTNGRNLVEERFTWSKIATEMIDVYRWILGEAPRPDCVTTD